MANTSPVQAKVGRSVRLCLSASPRISGPMWVPSGFDGRGCLSPLVACDAEISSLWWAKCRQSRFWVRLLVARCLRTWRRQGRPATACTPDRRLPVAPTQGGCGRRRRLLPATPRSVARGWRSVGNPGMQGSRTGAGVCFWVRLLVARRLRKWRRRTGKSVRSLGFCSSVPNSCFVPNLRAYRGMLGRACCRSPAATLECVVGRRALACLLGHCVRNGRVSGDWRVWACWIPARAATTSPASRFSRRPKRAPALAAVGFLCCIPIAKAFHCPERPVFALRCTPRGRGAGWTSRRPLCPTSRARPHVPGSLAHCVVARSLGCGTHGGYEGLGLCLPRKQAFGASCERRPPPFWARPMRAAESVRNATWLILPVVICLSQRLSHACVSMN